MRQRIVAAVAAAALLLSGCGKTKTPVTLQEVQVVKTLSFVVGSQLDMTALEEADRFADRVEKLSDGLLRVEVTTGLPDYSTISDGEADITYLRNGEMSQISEIFLMFSLPFLYDDYAHMSIALNSEEVLDTLGPVLSSKNIHPLMALYNGSTFLLTDKRELRVPADYKDLVIAMRTNNAAKLEFFEAMGARVLPYPQSMVVESFGAEVEVLPEDPFTAPDIRVTVDTAEVSCEEALSVQYDPESLYFIRTYHSISPLWLVINEQTYGELTPKERAVLEEACAGLLAETESRRVEAEEKLFSEMESQGMTIVDVDRQKIAISFYGSDGKGTDRYQSPKYLNSRLYQIIQNYA